MTSKTETDKFLALTRENSSSRSNNCCSLWWHQGYRAQKFISRIIESIYFRSLVMLLIILDTTLLIIEIMLDIYKSHYECNTHVYNLSKNQDKVLAERIEIATEIAHYSSIAILSLFFIELLVKIYALGKNFWNIQRKKMEYLDAFIVTTSLIIDLYFLVAGKQILGEELILLFSFRLWRFIRIIDGKAKVLVFSIFFL